MTTVTKPVAAPATTKTLHVQGVNVFLLERGAGTPTLFLHGVPDTAEMWHGIMARLEDQSHCLAPDLPGLGRSTAPADFDLSLENRARFVDGLVAALGIREPLNLVVHDFGGHYGLAWAVRHPAQVRRIAISNTAFFSTYQWHSNARLFRTPLLGELVMALTNPRLFARSMRQGGAPHTDAQLHEIYTYALSKPAVRRMILSLYRRTNPADFLGWEDELRALTARVPTCMLWGDKDPFVAPDFADRFGAGTVHHFAAYGHWAPLEAAGTIAAILREFFA